MKRSLPAALFAAILLSGCGGGGGGGDADGDGTLSLSDANALTQTVTGKVGGASMSVQSGPLPTPSTSAIAPKLSSGVLEVSALPGETVNVPVSAQTANLLSRLCLKIGVADTTLCGALSGNTAQARVAALASSGGRKVPAKQLADGQEDLLLTLDLPPRLQTGGQFCVDVVVQDVENLTSNIEQVCVKVRASLPDANQVSNDQPAAAELPALLADGEWIGPCLAVPRPDSAARSFRPVVRFELNSGYAALGEFWNDANCATQSTGVRPAFTGSYTAGAPQFNRQLQRWQRPFDFIPQAQPVGGMLLTPCFNTLRLDGDTLVLGVPQGLASEQGRADVPGSCVSAATRPLSLAINLPYTRRARPVQSANLPPLAVAGTDRNVDAGQTVMLDGSASSDPDGQVVTYQWASVDGAGPLQNANTAVASLVMPQTPGPYRFRLTVTDDRGASTQDEVTLNVLQPTARAVNAGADRIVTSGSAVQLSGTATGSGLSSVQWLLESGGTGPGFSLQNATSLTPSFVAPTQASGTRLLSFRLSATYSDGTVLQDSVVVEVTPVQISGGALRFTLTWDTGNTDLDLYVREPSGTVLSFPGDCSGPATETQPATGCVFSPDGGALDVDDVDGFGPENIFYPQPPPDGLYCFGVHFFPGSGNAATPSTYTLRISFNGQTQVQTGTLQAPGNGDGFVLTKSGGTAQYRVATSGDANICPAVLLQ